MIKDLKSNNKNQVKRTLVGNVVISTIHIDDVVRGMDSAISTVVDLFGGAEKHGLTDLSKPGDYETMVFNCEEDGYVSDWDELDFQRYDSEEAALKGHTELVTKYSKEVTKVHSTCPFGIPL